MSHEIVAKAVRERPNELSRRAGDHAYPEKREPRRSHWQGQHAGAFAEDGAGDAQGLRVREDVGATDVIRATRELRMLQRKSQERHDVRQRNGLGERTRPQRARQERQPSHEARHHLERRPCRPDHEAGT